MRISIFGLGYVGIVTSALLSKEHQVTGVDINPIKISLMKEGQSPIIEKGIAQLIKEGRKRHHLEATIDSKYTVMNSDISIICVGTPSKDDGSHDLNYLYKVLKTISEVLKEKKTYHLVVIRSTIPPGTTEKIIKKYFDKPNVGVCFNPEFLREGVAVSDYLNPPYIIAACNDDKGIQLMKKLYRGINAEFIVVSFKEAETLKIVNNIFHALKIVFANEVARFCEAYNINPKKIMGLVCKDKKLNISKNYLNPGFAYGGSCLAKELRCFQYLSRIKKIEIPVISNIELSNDKHIKSTIKKIESFKIKKIGFVG